MRVLILQLKRIGDALLTTPVISALREHQRGAEITIALDRATAALAPALGADHTLIRGDNFWTGLATSRFDVCLDLTGNDRSALATVVSRAPRRITWARFARKPLRKFLYTDFVESSVKLRHTADHHTDLLRALEIHVEEVPLALQLPTYALAEATNALARAGITSSFAVVHPGTARQEKYWLPERWAEVIICLRREHGLPVLLTGSKDPAEAAHLAVIQAALPEPCLNLAGKLSLLGTAAVLKKARLLCAVDSAPVHFADALETPVVALFGPTNPLHWRPRRTSAHIVTPAIGKAPMDQISTASVLKELAELPRGG